MVNGIGCSPSASPSPRRRCGFSSHLNKFCQHLQVAVPPLAIPNCLRPERSRLLSQSSEALSSVQVQTAPVAAPKPALEPKKTPDAPKACSFSAPVKGVAATVVAGLQDSEDSSSQISISSVRCELVAGLLNECSVVDHFLVIDCRSFVAYNANHVRGALNISCADCISRKRLLTGRITIADLVSGSDDAKGRYQRAVEVVKSGNKNAVQLIVYDEDTVNYDELPANNPLRLVVSFLLKTGFDVYYMFGELTCFCDIWCLVVLLTVFNRNRGFSVKSRATVAAVLCLNDTALSRISPRVRVRDSVSIVYRIAPGGYSWIWPVTSRSRPRTLIFETKLSPIQSTSLSEIRMS